MALPSLLRVVEMVRHDEFAARNRTYLSAM